MSSVWVQERQDRGELESRKVPRTKNPADVMTKQEHFPAFQRMRSRMNIR